MKVYCVISHTHWDREWYLPLSVFRLKLVDLIDRCLKTLEKYPDYIFHLDAQTVVLEDYLSIRPGRRQDLERYIRQGRLVVGPWYLQNDLYLTSGEATVRNLLEGGRLCREFGAEPCPVGYLPDQFGNISQLPQILKDFGIGSVVFGRGYSFYDEAGKRLPTKSEFLWRGPDGTQALAVHMKFWYNNAQRFSAKIQNALGLLELVDKQFQDVALTPYLLLMNGVDHLEAQDDLLPILEQVQKELPQGEEIRQMRLDDYIAQVREYLEENQVELPRHTGELREGGDWEVLSGTLSSRAYLKRANAMAQHRLEHQLEPLYAMLYYYGGGEAYSLDHFRYMWKSLMQNHPHDSICGCSRDEVHAHMEDNYARLGEMSQDMLVRGMRTMAEHMPAPDDAPYRVLVVNPTELERSGPVSVSLDLLESDNIQAFALEDAKGRPVEFTVKSSRPVRRDVFSPINLPGVLDVIRYELEIYVDRMAPFSARNYFVKKRDSFPPLAQPGQPGYKLENEFFTAQVAEDGKVTVTDKRTGKCWEDLLELEDTADQGDSYVYVPGNGCAVYGSQFPAEVTPGEAGPFRQSCRVTRTLLLPTHYDFDAQARSAQTAPCKVTLELALERGVPHLEVSYTLDNQAKDHRLRLLVRTGVPGLESMADIPFDMVAHKPKDHCPVALSDTLPNATFALVKDGDGGVAVLTEGSYEYEHTDGAGTLAFTLVRATGVISREADHCFTNGDTWLCPGNQCLRVLEGRLGVAPFLPGEEDTAALLARGFHAPLLAYADACDSRKFSGGRPAVQDAALKELFYLEDQYPGLQVPEDASLLQVTGKGLAVTAVKRAEDGNGLILRVVNLSAQGVEGTVRCAGEMSFSSMSEQGTGPAVTGELRHCFRPKEILTLRVLPQH